MIYHIYEFRNKLTCTRSNNDYKADLDTCTDEQYKNMIENMNSKHEFHIWFNELFEKYNLKDNDDGHGEWFKSDRDLSQANISNQSQLHDYINQVKSEKRDMYALQKHNIADRTSQLSTGSSSLDKDNDTFYSISSHNLTGNDLKEAFQNTVIPVTQEDYENRTHYQNIFQLQNHRKQTEVNPISEDKANKIFFRKV